MEVYSTLKSSMEHSLFMQISNLSLETLFTTKVDEHMHEVIRYLQYLHLMIKQ